MEHLDVKRHLPFGVNLRDILLHPSFTTSNRKNLLRQKGIFIDSSQENSVMPLLITSLLSASQFDYIKEKIKTKEDREKIYTRELDWSAKNTLLSAIPSDFNVTKIVQDAFPKFTITTQTPFTMIEGSADKIKMEFTCQTNNYNSSWYRTKEEFKGQVNLEKVQTGDKVYLRIKYTSPETQNIADKVVKTLTKSFKENNMTKSSEEERILYKNFTNSERFSFFLSLLSGNETFQYEKMVNIDVAPDPTETPPDEFKWLEESKVKELNINGERVDKSPFIMNTAAHPFLEIAGMDIVYNFRYFAAEGNCKIRFGFEGYFLKRLSNIEFSIDVSSINLKDEYSHVNKYNVQTYLLEAFDKWKIECYNLFKYKQISNQFTPN